MLREVGYLKAVQRAVQARPLVFIPHNLSGLCVFVVTVIGGIPTEHGSIEKLLGVIWIMEVFETTVAHGLKPFYHLDVLKLMHILCGRPPCGESLESDCSSSKQFGTLT